MLVPNKKVLLVMIVATIKTIHYAAGPPGFGPGTSGSEGPGYISRVSNENHKLET